MNITLLSDIHLEFGGFNPGQGDVLLLCGDVCVADDFLSDPVEASKYRKFFDQCVAGYNKVFYILGNHELYHGDVKTYVDIIRRHIPEEITLLNNTSEVYEGVHFVGATLWSDFMNGDPLMMHSAGTCMNDYQCVLNNSPEAALQRHQYTMDWFRSVVPTLRGPVVMMTHHAPSFQSIWDTYASRLEGAYATDLEQFILDHPNIKYWCHGHIHSSNDYQVGQCRVMANPRGYHAHALNPNFDPSFTFTVDSSETVTKYLVTGIV